jgi:hypothetical protein
MCGYDSLVWIYLAHYLLPGDCGADAGLSFAMVDLFCLFVGYLVTSAALHIGELVMILAATAAFL